MFNKFILLIILFFTIGFAIAQKTEIPIVGDQEGSTLNVLYRNEAMGKIYVSSRGYGILYRRAKHVTAKTRSFYEIDYQGLKHQKEVKVSGTSENRKRYVYGKLNSVGILRGGIGFQNVIFAKADSKAVEVRFSYSAGPMLSFAKPYYYQLPSFGPSIDGVEVKFDPEHFTQDSVSGKGRFSTGLAETSIYPGISGKFNLSFEYAAFTNLIRAIETGITIDYFPKALPIMARNPSEYVVITLHVGFVFGKKWF